MSTIRKPAAGEPPLARRRRSTVPRASLLLLLIAISFTLWTAPMSAQTPPSTVRSTSEIADRLAIADVVASVAYLADARDWDALRTLYADSVRVDYTSLNGGEPATVQADELIASWRGLLPGFDATQHLLGPVLVELDGDRAVARTHVRALHRIAGAEGGEEWVVGGHYTYSLARQGDRWVVTDHTLGNAYQQGNIALPGLAQGRAGGAKL